MSLQKFVAWLLVLPIPSAVWSFYLYASRLTRYFNAATDYAAFAIALAVGIVGIFMLARSRQSQLVATALYVPSVGLGMYLGMLATACSAGDCP